MHAEIQQLVPELFWIWTLRQAMQISSSMQCQKPHHTLLHVENQDNPPSTTPTNAYERVIAAVGLKTNSLLMTCRVMVSAADGTSVKARAILDSTSSALFLSERLAQSLYLPRSNQNARIAGISHKFPIQSITTFNITAVRSSSKKIGVTAVIIPRVTCDLPPAVWTSWLSCRL